MKKVLITLILLLVMLLGGIFLFNKKEQSIDLTSDLTCHLGIQDCEFDYKDRKVKISITPKPLRAMVPTTIKLSGLNENFTNLNVKVEGLNMDMGIIKADFIQKGEIYEGILSFNACSTDMVYNMKFFDGNNPIGLEAKFVMKN